MRHLLIAGIITLALATPAAAQEAAGDWKGALETPNGTMRIVMHIDKTDSGYAVTGDSVDQGAYGLIGQMQSHGPVLKLYFPQAQGTYEGKWDEAKKAYVGAWSQNGVEAPLTLAQDAPKS